MKTQRAKLGLRIEASGSPDNEPRPGSPEFGERADARRKRIMNRRRRMDVYIERDESLQDYGVKA